MPTMKISMKCTCFFKLQYCVRILPLSPQQNLQNHPHFTHLKIRWSADPHFTGGQYRATIISHDTMQVD